MKLKITRSDGVIIELDGSTEEVKAIIGTILPVQPFTINYPYVGVGTSPYATFCQHEYPLNWNGTVPPNCIKCGM